MPDATDPIDDPAPLRPRPSAPQEQRKRRPVGAGQRPPGARPRRPRPAGDAPRTAARGPFGDVNRLLIIGIIATIVSILGMLVAALTLGDLGGTKAPRTYVERQVSMLESTVKASPDNGKAWAELARALLDSNQNDRAAGVIRQGLIAAANDKAPVLVEQARLEFRQGDSKKALETADKAIAEANKFRALLVEQYRAKGIVMDTRAMPMDAVISGAILKSVIFQKQGKPQDAIDALTIALNEKGTMADVLTQRGLLYLDLKRYQEARNDLEKALAFIPDYAEARAGIQRLKAVSK